MHTVVSPAILYFGTPVVLITTNNPDGTPNIGCMSSAWFLGHRSILGLDASSQTPTNLLRTKQCVLNLPSDDMVGHVNRIARTTGTDPVSAKKLSRGYNFVKDKFSRAGLTSAPADYVDPPLIEECPVQLEAELVIAHEMMSDLPDRKGMTLVIEVKILRVHVDERIRMEGYANRVDPDKWHPMIMSFQELYGLKREKLDRSDLGNVEEESYRAFTRSDVIKQGGDMDLIHDGNTDQVERKMKAVQEDGVKGERTKAS